MADQLKTSRVRTPMFVRNVQEANIFLHKFRDHTRERMIVVHMTPIYEATAVQVAAIGTMSSVHFEMHDIFRKAILMDTKCLLIAHNHPYEKVIRPSSQDLKLTDDLVTAGKSLKIPVLDHVILTKTDIYSFRESGLCGFSKSASYKVEPHEFYSFGSSSSPVSTTIILRCGRRST